MAIRLQIRRGSATEWSSANPILAEGELGVELDTKKFKIGDGVQHWNDIEYATGIQGPRGKQGERGLPGIQGPPGTLSAEQLAQLVKNESNVEKLKFENGKLYVFDGSEWHENKGGGGGMEEVTLKPMRIPEPADLGGTMQLVEVRKIV